MRLDAVTYQSMDARDLLVTVSADLFARAIVMGAAEDDYNRIAKSAIQAADVFVREFDATIRTADTTPEQPS